MRILPEVLQRIYTAIPLIACGLFAIFYFNWIGFLLVDTLLISMIAWEWSHICGYENSSLRIFYLITLLMGCKGIYYVPVQWLTQLSFVMALCLIGSVIITVICQKNIQLPKAGLLFLGGIYLLLAWYMLGFLKSNIIGLCMGLLIVILTDTLAYIVGINWGHFPLAPHISPRKTWEGCLAGLFGPVLIILMIDKLSGYSFGVSRSMLGIILLTSLTTIAGDLFESAIKRKNGLKDSGNSLPGHGGWLDRFDGLVCAIPVFSSSLLYLAVL